MMRTKNKSISGILTGVGIGWLVGFLITVLGAAATAVLIAGEKLWEQQVVYGAAASLLLGTFVGALLASSIAGEKRMLVCIGFGVAFFVILICVTAMFFDGMYENIWETALLILGSSAAVGLIGVRRKPTSFRSRKRRVRMP